MNRSFASKSEALAVGKEKLKLFATRKGWKINVWENLGWHLAFDKGHLNLHYSPEDNSFMAFLSENNYGGDSIFWHESYSNKDPNKVIANKLRVAKAFVKRCQNVIAEVEK